MSSLKTDKRRNLITICAATTSALTQATVLGILTALLVVDLATTRLRVPVLVSIVFNAVVVLTMLAIVAGQPMKTPFLIAEIGFSLATAILSLYIFIRCLRSTRSLTASLVVAGLVVWSINILTQSVAYVLLAACRRKPEEITTIGYRYPTSSPRKRFSLSFRTQQPTTPEKAHPYSPSLKSSRHGSVSQVFGPLGSKTRLLISQTLHRDSESQLAKREPSLEIACRGETPEPPVYELSSSPPLAKSPLSRMETIPGSRPVSPAKPLHPFLQDTPERMPLPASPTLSRAQSPSSTLSTSPHDLPFPPMIGEVACQSHIHPLFRSDSPGPPPSMSPGTSVTGGHVSTEALRRQRSAHNSRSATPDVVDGEVPNFSRPGIVNGPKPDVRSNMI